LRVPKAVLVLDVFGARAALAAGPALLLSILSAFLGMFGCFSTVPGAEQAPASSSLT
jgi:hypothetical protein